MDAIAHCTLAITLWFATRAQRLPGGQVVLTVNPGSLLASKTVTEGLRFAGLRLL